MEGWVRVEMLAFDGVPYVLDDPLGAGDMAAVVLHRETGDRRHLRLGKNHELQVDGPAIGDVVNQLAVEQKLIRRVDDLVLVPLAPGRLEVRDLHGVAGIDDQVETGQEVRQIAEDRTATLFLDAKDFAVRLG